MLPDMQGITNSAAEVGKLEQEVFYLFSGKRRNILSPTEMKHEDETVVLMKCLWDP